MEQLKDVIQRIMARIPPDPNRSLHVLLCKLLDKLAIVKIDYDSTTDSYDISYEDTRKEIRNIFVSREDITNAHL